jgi:hypothetical protein
MMKEDVKCVVGIDRRGLSDRWLLEDGHHANRHAQDHSPGIHTVHPLLLHSPGIHTVHPLLLHNVISLKTNGYVCTRRFCRTYINFESQFCTSKKKIEDCHGSLLSTTEREPPYLLHNRFRIFQNNKG